MMPLWAWDLRMISRRLCPPPVFLATPHHGPLRPEGHGDLQGGLRDERSIKSHHIYVPNGLRPPFFALYYPHYRVYPFFSSVPGRGSVSTADERRQCSVIVYGDSNDTA